MTSTFFSSTENDHSAFNMRLEELFVVQRCWHSGPNVFTPVDMARLFTSRQEAEGAAYHSAHAWSRAHNDANVRTLLLPPSQIAQTNIAQPTPTSTYAFVTSGAMFWVRPLLMTMTDASRLISTEGVISTIQAYGVFTDGVIGGTGKRFGRGSEIGHGRVFACSSSHNTAIINTAEQRAQQICDACNSNRPTTQIRPIPIGKSNDFYPSGQFLHDWPGVIAQEPQYQQQQPTASVDAMELVEAFHKNKRTMEEFEITSSNISSASSSCSNSTHGVPDSLFSPSFEACSATSFIQTAKRRRMSAITPTNMPMFVTQQQQQKQKQRLEGTLDEEMVMG